jgi:pyruvate/2-oxoglutarate dehydrogenase complex dihydrolipoamide acyltransferase (E2) component
MASIIRMPKLGLEMEQGTVLEWFFEPGDEVSEGDKMAEVESEKSIGEVEAREDGTLRQIHIEEGEAVPPGKPIGILAEADADISDLETEVEAELEGETEEEPAAAEASAPDADAETADTQEVASTASSGGGGADIKASPRAKKQAEELGVDLSTVEGTGPMDSITAEDVEAAAETRSTAETSEVSQTGSHRYQRATVVADPAAGSALLDTPEAVRSAFAQRVPIIDVALVVASSALGDRPLVNATYTESTHQLQERQNIALVADSDEGRDRTVIPGVDEKSLTEVVEAREERDGDTETTPSFTIANAADVEPEGLLVNQPAVAGLELDPSGQRAVPTDDGVDLQPLVTAKLTYDTRAIDRSEAEAFLNQLFERAEQASELILGSYRGKE